MNKNSWTTIEIINDWIKSIIIPYARNKCNNKKILLIWDRAKTHLNEDTVFDGVIAPPQNTID